MFHMYLHLEKAKRVYALWFSFFKIFLPYNNKKDYNSSDKL